MAVIDNEHSVAPVRSAVTLHITSLAAAGCSGLISSLPGDQSTPTGSGDADVSGPDALINLLDAGAPGHSCSTGATLACECEVPDAVGTRRCPPGANDFGRCECTNASVNITVSPSGSAGLPLDQALAQVELIRSEGWPARGVAVWLSGAPTSARVRCESPRLTQAP